jgi:hypothetical protein
MIWGIISLILLLIIIGLTIWLLVRQSNVCPDKKKLNENCSNTIDCNSGLVCSVSTSGITGGTGNICKVAFGGVCSTSSECGSGLSCNGGICSTSLGTGGQPCPCATGFTCINNICRAIVGKPCTNGTDCATGVCINSVCGVTGMTGSHYNTDSFNYTDSRSRRYNSSDSCSDKYSHSRRSTDSYSGKSSTDSHSRKSSTDSYSRKSSTDSYSRKSSTDSYSGKYKDSSKHSKSFDDSSKYPTSLNSSLLFSCTDTDCDGTRYSLNSSENSSISRHKPDSSSFDRSRSRSRSRSRFSSSDRSSSCSPKRCRKRYNSSSLTSNYSSSHDSYVRRGVYATNASNNDRTLFTSIEEPIIDITKNTNNGFLLLLKDGNIVLNSGTSNTMLLTNKKMFRMIRFGTEVIGLDRKGKLYYRDRTNSITNTWNWEHLKNYPSDVQFIASTNTPYTKLEVLTCRGKALLYTFSTNWKNGNVVNTRKTRNPRYYGATVSRYIDINETNNVGKTNDSVIVKHIKGAGFYSSGMLVSVLTEDTFTHVRIIDSNAYFLFEQC